jgi:hypothetical protein
MNTKFSFMLFAVLIVLIVNACAPTITDDAAPVAIAVPPAAEQTSAIVPVTGNSASETVRAEAQAPRLWSGEVFLSDNDAPDITLGAEQDRQSACMSEDDLPRRYSGCVE